MTDSGPLILPNRRGKLPPDIAYLLAKYPREVWSGHLNFDGAASLWISRHNQFREWGALLRQLSGSFREGDLTVEAFQRQFAPRLNAFLGHLDGHHNVEDYAYFPLFRAKDKRLVIGFDLLENDHGVIHQQLTEAAESANALLAALAKGGDERHYAADRYADVSERLLAYLLRHLEDEEDLIVPTILEHTDGFLHG